MSILNGEAGFRMEILLHNGLHELTFESWMEKINSAPALYIIAPQTEEEWLHMNTEWKNKSTNEIIAIAGCVTALDGFFQRCNKEPTKKETLNTLAFITLDIMSPMLV
eukprot:scaffold14836_cov79-Cyclotella_meneghiniana.AAC.1